MYTVYILYCKSIDRYYVGSTNDIARRLAEHNRKKGKFTDAGIPLELVHTEEYKTKKEGMERERYIKSRKSRTFIIDLVAGG
jgi:putative endonuclease